MAQGRRGDLARRVGGRRHLRSVALAVVGFAAAVVLWRRGGRLRWYRLVYQTCYVLGLRVWERDVPAADLVALVEGPTALLVGTPGWSYDQGDGLVYPAGLPKGNRLARYSRLFPLVEIDSTYYATPRSVLVRR